LPSWIVNKFLLSVDTAEDKLGRPPNALEVFVEMEEFHGSPVKNCFQVAAVLCSIHREDWLLSNKSGYNWTRRPQEGFRTYSQIFRDIYPGYGVDSNQTVVATTAKTVNYEFLLDVLRSKDEKLMEENSWLWDYEFRLLDGKDISSFENKICFNTMPRSGSSWLRRFIEQITGISTGASTSLHSATLLQNVGLKGEAITDDRCFIIKSTHPMFMPGSITFGANKVLWLVRNPMDVIVSFASLMNTCSHTHKPEWDYAKDYP